MHREPKVLEELLAKLADACGRVPRRADRGRSRRRPDLRLVGGRALARRLRPLRAPRDRTARVAPAAALAGPGHPLRLGLGASGRLVRGDAGRRPLHRLEAPARRGAEARERQGAAGERRPWRPSRNARWREGSRVRRAPRGRTASATSSTSATASSRPRLPRTSPRSSRPRARRCRPEMGHSGRKDSSRPGDGSSLSTRHGTC